MDIPLFKIFWDEDDIDSVKERIKSGKYWATGPEIDEFENEVSDYLGIGNCLAFNSGGSALHSLMEAYGFGSGDEIIVPSFTFIATGYAPLYVGAEPVFADVEFETFGLDPEDVKEKISSKTEAIMPIHYGGMPCKIKDLKDIAEDHDLVLIEDAAESFGAKYKDKSVGTFGDSAMFSLCHNKVFTSGEGGLAVTNNDEISEKMELIRSYGRVVEGDYFKNPENLDYKRIGNNFRMSTLLAALGRSQLRKVDKTIEKRRENAKYLNQRLRSIEEIIVPDPPSDKYFPVYQMYTIRVKDGEEVRSELSEFLMEKGITTRIYFDPIHEYSVFKELGYRNVELPKTQELSSQVLTLPLYPDISKEEMDYVIDNITEFFGR